MASQDNALSPFPDILAPKEKKQMDEYGIQYAKAIWSTYTSNSYWYNSQRQRDIINRQYAEGLESIEKYKAWKGISNTSYQNLDFSPINIIATTIDNIVGRLLGTPLKIQCNPIDSESKSRFDDYRAKLYADMFLKEFSDQSESLTGISLVKNKQNLPETSEEAELHLKMNFKDDASIAMEEAFNYVLSSNDFETSREQILRDLLTIKRAAIQRYYDEDKNLKFEYIDAVDVITPYSKYQDFKNIPYIAVIKNYTIGQIAVMHKFKDEELYDIARQNAGKSNNPAWNWGQTYEGYYVSDDFTINKPYQNFNIQVLEFYFLAIDKERCECKTYVRKDGVKKKYFNKVASDYISKDENSEIIDRDIQNTYEGKWIIGTKYIYNYCKEQNMPREKINGSFSPKSTLPIKIIAPGIYDMKNKSHVERAIPFEDQINLANLAFQTMLIKAKPPGVAVDIDGIMEATAILSAGQGGQEFKPLDMVKIYEETGNYIYSSKGSDGNAINSRVVTELRGGVSDAINQLISIHQFQKNQIYEVIGLNPTLDPSSTTATDVGLGVQDNAISATNNSLKPIYNAHIRLLESGIKELGLMIQDCIEYDNEAFKNAIGTYSTKVLEMGKSLAFVQLGIKIEILPDEKEKAGLVGMMQLGIQNGSLNSSDAIRINQVMKQDVKLAAQLLVFLESKNRKDKMKESQALQEQNGAIQQQSAQAAAEANTQAEIAINGSKAELLKLEYKLKDEFEQRQIQRQLMLQGSKNEGMEVVAAINTQGKENVQHSINQGKTVVAAINKETNIEKAHIAHHSSMSQIALDSAVNNKPDTDNDNE